jgi:hypothetical protein
MPLSSLIFSDVPGWSEARSDWAMVLSKADLRNLLAAPAISQQLAGESLDLKAQELLPVGYLFHGATAEHRPCGASPWIGGILYGF